MKAILENSCRLRVEAYKKMDSNLFASVFANHGKLLLTGGHVITGRNIIEEKMDSFMHLVGPMEVNINIQNYWEVDNIIYEQGKYLYTSIDNGKVFNKGTYVIHWQKQDDGDYKIIDDIEIDII